MRLPKLSELLHSPIGETWATQRLPVLIALGSQLAILGLYLWGAL